MAIEPLNAGVWKGAFWWEYVSWAMMKAMYAIKRSLVHDFQTPNVWKGAFWWEYVSFIMHGQFWYDSVFCSALQGIVVCCIVLWCVVIQSTWHSTIGEFYLHVNVCCSVARECVLQCCMWRCVPAWHVNVRCSLFDIMNFPFHIMRVSFHCATVDTTYLYWWHDKYLRVTRLFHLIPMPNMPHS